MPVDVLAGGVANAGAVVRDGDVVLRPAPPPGEAEAVHGLFRTLRDAGFDGVPAVLDPPFAPDGRERLRFVAGEVAIPPWPAWATTPDAAASVGRLLRRYHEAVASIDVPEVLRSRTTAMADPEGGPILCHNDLCPENVVFVDGEASVLLDFDFAAFGRPLWDLATTARMWLRFGDDPRARLDAVCDGYGLSSADRAALPGLMVRSIEVGRAMVLAQVEAGHPAFVAMWEETGGEAGYEERRLNLQSVAATWLRRPR